MRHARSRAREAALKALYQVDVLGGAPDEQKIEELFARERLRERSLGYARRLTCGCLESQAELDARIAAALENWELARLGAVDRCILRIGTYELVSGGDVPAKAAIDEAIELAKKYSTEKSGSFINGILDRILKSREGEV